MTPSEQDMQEGFDDVVSSFNLLVSYMKVYRKTNDKDYKRMLEKFTNRLISSTHDLKSSIMKDYLEMSIEKKCED